MMNAGLSLVTLDNTVFSLVNADRHWVLHGLMNALSPHCLLLPSYCISCSYQHRPLIGQTG